MRQNDAQIENSSTKSKICQFKRYTQKVDEVYSNFMGILELSTYPGKRKI